MPDGSLITCTLLGKLAQHNVVHDASAVDVETVWTGETKNLQKVSAMSVKGAFIAIGGFGKDDKGLVEVMSLSTEEVDLVKETESLSVSDSSINDKH